jgi:PIN domain nuclease of toxin-antitoxin system
MRLLLDSHVFLWWIGDDPRLGPGARELIQSSDLWFSVASYWELGIKIAAHRLVPPAAVMEELERNRVNVLPVTIAHADEAAQLPFLHGDPFDRMLVAQARCEDLVLMTSDRALGRYDVPIIRP